MHEELVALVRCPVTKDIVRLISSTEIGVINQRIIGKELLHLDGSVVGEILQAGLISRGGQFAYRIDDGIAVLLRPLAIVLRENETASDRPEVLCSEKAQVRDFYEEFGWRKPNGEHYNDALIFEDLRPVVRQYIHRCHPRVNRHLPRDKQYLLDVASGPVQLSEYVSFSDNFQKRICVDISFLALKEARERLGGKGIYILGDITNLPILDRSVDAAVSLHTIYHVPRDEQAQAIQEIYRVLKPGSRAVVIYGWSRFFHSLPLISKAVGAWRRLLRAPRLLVTLTFRRQPRGEKAARPDTLYFHAHDYRWFRQQLRGIPHELLVWRSLSAPFTKRYVHSWLFGRQILNLIYALEERYPRIAGTVGIFPMFVLRK